MNLKNRTSEERETEQEVYVYNFALRGTWDRKRKPDFMLVKMCEADSDAEQPTTDELRAWAERKLEVLKVHKGSTWYVRQRKETVKRTVYPNGGWTETRCSMVQMGNADVMVGGTV